jgi:membrane-associated protease RseP (regulator of RpoE activity)
MDDGRVALVIEPQRQSPEAPPPLTRSGIAWNVLLLALTLVTTTWAGASHRGGDEFRQPSHYWAGLWYSLPLLLILGVHELGHYLMARRRGVDASLPYFIPVPFGLGTFGAVIRIRSPFPDRRAAFDVGIAGPLAGLAVALPALIFGLQTSELVPASAGIGTQVTSSLLLGWIASWLATGDLTAADAIVFSPLAFAGWLGLLLTALNLLPIGQLDGGHIAYGLLGRRRARQVGLAALLLLVLLGIFYWSGWLVWAFIAFFLTGVQHDPAREEIRGISFSRRVLGVAALVLLLLIMVPVPHRFMQPLGIACPYL